MEHGLEATCVCVCWNIKNQIEVDLQQNAMNKDV